MFGRAWYRRGIAMKLGKPVHPKPCERQHDRFMLADAWLEWTDSAGRPWKFQILDVSLNGVGLGLTVEGTGMKEGVEMRAAHIRIEGLEIRGTVIVTQASQSLSRGDACGGEFHAATVDDEQRFRQVVAYLARRARRALVT
jgi:hypothetical protein